MLSKEFLDEHIVTFGRVLRRAGLDVGSDQVVAARQAVHLVDLRRKDDFYQALFCTFVRSRSQIELFDRAFHLFWHAPTELPEVMADLLSRSTIASQRRRSRDGAAARERPLMITGSRNGDDEEAPEEPAATAYSPVERLRKKDFARFTVEEIAEAQAFIQNLTWPFEPDPVRRFSRVEKGRRFDFRRTLRRGLRYHGELFRLYYGGRKRRDQRVVLLCDVSGSMEVYSRMLLRFMHAVSRRNLDVESFVFGTRLTRVTRHLHRRDVDEALSAVAHDVEDWAGGTRIGESLKTFNFEWLRRVLRSRGVVLIISDGCDRGDPELLGRELARLARSCRTLLWLNPLLGYGDYQPLTRGMQAALPHIDYFLPVHNLESLERLQTVLSRLPTDHRRPMPDNAPAER